MSFVNVNLSENIAILEINRPEGLNALNTEVLSDLLEAISALHEEEDLRALIVTGAGEKSFVAGADIGEMSGLNSREAENFGHFGSSVFEALRQIPCPVIAAVNGYALGGGFELALACDIRLASTTARFAFPETGLGITPGFGGTQRLAKLCGTGVASELIFTGRRVKAEEALALGIVNKVVEPDQLIDEALEMAKAIADKAPIAVAKAKQAIYASEELSIEQGLDLEAAFFAHCFETQDQKRAMKAFLDKEEFHDFQNL
ncbi:MAG: enoyl-CoA hydratase-related protein [Eubacteriales bacterium]|nr:enoyl-CoA hydratase-related protein [Eubacteriales bacterium]